MTKQNTDLAAQPENETIKALLIRKQADIKQLLPTHVNVDRFIKSALLAVARNDRLLECSPASVFTSVVNAAELGLDFTPAKGHAYLIPYKREATFMPGFRGMIELAKRSGTIIKIEAHVVYEKDIFDIEYGLDPKLIHKPCIKGNQGNVTGAYAIAWFKGDDPQYEYMTREQLDGIRKRAKTDYVWQSDFSEMCRKTAVRRLFKYLPCSPDLEKAIEFDNAIAGINDGSRTPKQSGTAALAEMIAPESTPEPRTVNMETGEVEQGNPEPKPTTKAQLAGAILDIRAKLNISDDKQFYTIVGAIIGQETASLDEVNKAGLEQVHAVFSKETALQEVMDKLTKAGSKDLFDGVIGVSDK